MGLLARSSLRPRSSRPCTRNPPNPLTDCGVRPRCPMTGTPRSDDLPDDVLVAVNAFELDRVRAASQQRTDSRSSQRNPLAVGQKRQIGDDELASGRARHRRACASPSSRRWQAASYRGRASPSQPSRRRESRRRSIGRPDAPTRRQAVTMDIFRCAALAPRDHQRRA